MQIIVRNLSKAVKPYTRTRKGKMEHVRGHERTGLSRVSSAGGFQTGDDVVIWRGENQGKKGVIARTDGFHATVRHDDGTFTEEVAHHRLLKKSLEDGMNKSVMVVSLDEYLNKAVVEPYTRTKKGKMERVGSYSRAGEAKGKAVAGKPGEKEEYTKLKEFGHLLNEEGKARLAELEGKFEGEDRKKYETMKKMPEEHLSEFGKKHLAELEARFGKKEEVAEPLKPGRGGLIPKKEKPEEKPTVESVVAEEKKAIEGEEKYKTFFSAGKLNEDLYHAKLGDKERIECLKYGLDQYRERYVEKVAAGDLWADPEFKTVNAEIGKQEGMRRAFIDKADKYPEFNKRQALHIALKIQEKSPKWPSKWGEFNKAETGLKIFTLDELYKARIPG